MPRKVNKKEINYIEADFRKFLALDCYAYT